MDHVRCRREAHVYYRECFSLAQCASLAESVFRPVEISSPAEPDWGDFDTT